MLPQQTETMVWRWSIQVIQHGIQIEPFGGGLHQQSWVNCRLEQRQLTGHTVKVHAVADFEQPVCDGIPILEQLVVFWQAKVQGSAHAQQSRCLVVSCQ
jgi:hypothetical protein